MRRLPTLLLLLPLLAGLIAMPLAADGQENKKSPAAKESSKDAAAKPAEKPAVAKDAKPAEKPAEKPAAKPAEKPAAKPETAAKPAADESAKPATHRVKKALFRIEVTLDGIFEAQDATELVLRPQEWSGFTVLKAVEHGALVKRGDLLVSLDTEKIDRAIADLRAELQLSDLTLKQTEQYLEAAEKIAPLDMQSNQRTQRIAQEDLKQYLDVDRPLSVKAADFTLRQAKEYLEYQEEEYKQLEKMYKADDLVEETEAIVLRRARNSVDRAKLVVEMAQAIHDETVKKSIPRHDDRIKDSTARAEIEFNRAKITMPLTVNKQRLDFEKLKIQRAQSEEKLNKLMADRTLLNVKAPADGIVYFGRSTRGKWSTGSSSSDPLRRGASIIPNEVFMTLVQSRPLLIRSSVSESQLQHVRVGLQGLAEPAGLTNVKLTAIVQRVAAVPFAAGGFDTQLTVATDNRSEILMPGMTCEVKLPAYKNPDALAVPIKSVFSEELDPLKQFVYVLGKQDKPEKRPVTLGRRNDKQVELVQGVSEGDQVLLERPKE